MCETGGPEGAGDWMTKAIGWSVGGHMLALPRYFACLRNEWGRMHAWAGQWAGVGTRADQAKVLMHAGGRREEGVKCTEGRREQDISVRGVVPRRAVTQ